MYEYSLVPINIKNFQNTKPSSGKVLSEVQKLVYLLTTRFYPAGVARSAAEIELKSLTLIIQQQNDTKLFIYFLLL